MLVTDTVIDRIEVAVRNAEAHRRAGSHDLVVLALAVQRRRRAVVEIERARDAVQREVGVDRAQHHDPVRRARVELESEVVARAEHVLLPDAGIERELVGRGIAHAERDVAGFLLLHRDRQIDLVGRAGHFGGLDVDVGEVAQAVDAVARELDLAGVVPRALELPELAPYHLVAGREVAGHGDVAHVDAPLRVGLQDNRHLRLGAVDFRSRLDAREGIAERTVEVEEVLRRRRHGLRAEEIARADRDQALELVLAPEEVAVERDRGHRVGQSLADVHRDRDVLLVGRDRDLGRFDREFKVTAVQIEGLERLQVGVELDARITVALGVERQPAAGAQLEQAAQCALLEGLIADDADLADACRLALGDREREVDAVALDRRHRRHHLGGIETAREVLALELLLGAVGQRLVERQAFADADFAQRLQDRVLLELLHADEVDVGDDRPLLDDNDHHLAFDLDAHVLEQAGGEQRTQCGRALVVVVGVADTKGQRREHGAGIRALQALNANVDDDEGLDSPGRADVQRTGESEEQDSIPQEGETADEGAHAGDQCRPSRRATSL